MKINNKLILLIIMSLFLLISIGSVCASDNDLGNQTIQAYDENSDVLSIESEIEDDNAILSADNDNTLLKANSNKKISTTQTSINVNSSRIVEVNLNTNNKTIDINDLKPTVTYKDNNVTKTIKTSNYNLNNAIYSFKLDNLDFKTALLELTYKGDSISNITLSRIYNADIQVVKDTNEYRVGNYTFKVVDIDNNNKPIPNVEVSLTTTGNIRVGFSAKTDKNGIASFDANNLYEYSQSSSLSMEYLSAGYHNVTIATKDNIKSTAKTVRLKVTKGTVKIVVDKYSEPYGSDKNVTITVTKSNGAPLTGEMIHLYMPETSGKDYYFSTDSNGQCKINVKNLLPGDYSYTVSANNTKSIKLEPVTGTITINKVRVEFTIDTHDVYYNSDVTATVTVKYQGTDKVVPNAVIKVQAYETDGSYKEYRGQANDNGVVKISPSLSVGKHKIYVTIAEEDYEPRYTAYGKTAYVQVSFANAKYEAPKVTAYYKDSKTFDVRVVNVKNGNGMYDAKVNIKVYLSSTSYLSYTGTSDADGYIKLSLTDFDPGTYKVVISNSDTKNYASNQITSQFVIINRITTTLTASDVTTFYQEGKNIVATLKDANGKPIRGVNIGFANNGVKYYKTDANGQAKCPTTDLTEGTYNIKVAFFGDDKYTPSNKVNIKVTVTKKPTTITVQDVTTNPNESKNIVATLKDATGKPISGATIGFAVNGVKYYKTDANGQAKCPTTGLTEGTYYVKVSYYGNGTYAPSNRATSKVVITSNKIATKLTVTNLNAPYKSNKYIIALLTDENNNPISGASVGFAVNGVKYTTTDANGKARYFVNELPEGEYNIKVAYYGNDAYKASNKATSHVVISKIATKLTATKSGTSGSDKYIIASLKDENNNPISGANIGFANNGIKYYKTDTNGQAKYPTTDLTEGTYNIKVAFFGDDKYLASDKITVKVPWTKNLSWMLEIGEKLKLKEKFISLIFFLFYILHKNHRYPRILHKNQILLLFLLKI